MNYRILIFLVLIIINNLPLHADWSVSITNLVGKVELIDGDKKEILKTEKEIPSTGKLNIPKGSKIEISQNGITYTLSGKLENIEVSNLFLGNLSGAKTPTFALGVRGYKDTWNNLMKESEQVYHNYIKGKEVKDYNNWKPIIDSVFDKLVKSSGKEDFAMTYAIISDDSFNASAFPGGQFIIHVGTLKHIDAKIKDYKSTNPNLSDNDLRENLLAAILGHELAHFYNKHAFLSQKRIISGSKEEKITDKFILKQLKYSREAELDADSTGFLLLQKAGFDTIWVVNMLKILKEIVDSNETNNSPYFSTHPSPHMRLSQIPNDNREFHKWVAKMEFVFADIRAGQNLENSLEEIREALKKYPDNKEFLKAEATCLHKIWLNTVPFDEQQLRSILSIPSFKDSMISSDSSRKATNKIPGDKIKYMKALSAYHKAINLSQDPYFISNYSTLIVYSNKKESRDMAVILSELSANVNPDIQTINNLALVYFISGEKRELAYDLFNKLIFKISHLHSLYPGIKEEATNTQKLYSAMNSKYVSPNYTPALNLALTSIYLRKKEAHTIAKIYIQNIESKSEWAGFLSVLSGVEIPEDNLGNKVFSFQKLKIGSDESLINKIIKEKPLLSVPIEETKDGIKLSGKRNIYSETGISITTLSGKISIIEFFKNGQGLDKKIRIGKSEKEIIKSLKTKSQKRGKYNIYYGIKNNLAIQFENGKVKQIVLFN